MFKMEVVEQLWRAANKLTVVIGLLIRKLDLCQVVESIELVVKIVQKFCSTMFLAAKNEH